MITNKTCLAVLALFVGACAHEAFAFDSSVVMRKLDGGNPIVFGYATAFETGGNVGEPIGTTADIKYGNSDPTVAGWSGDGTYVATTNATGVVEYNSLSGVPYLEGLDGNDEMVNLWADLTTNTAVLVEGDLVFTNDLSWCEAAGENGVAVEGVSVDFMIRVSHPDEPPTLEDEGEATNDLQVCICAWTNGLEEVELEDMTDEQRAANAKVPLYLYCKNGNDTFDGDGVTVTSPANLQWVPLGKSVTTGSWIRVNLLIDYDHNTCRVSVDGNPCVTSKGFNKADSGEASSGAWYKLANQVNRYKGKDNETKSKINPIVNTLKFSGEAAIDNVVVQKVNFATFNPYRDSEGKSVTTNFIEGLDFDLIYLNEHDVTLADMEKARDENSKHKLEEVSGMTLREKLEAGIDPRSPEKFEMKTMEQSEDGSGNTDVAITFPGMHAVSHYSVTVAADPKGDNPLEGGKVTGVSVAKEENGANKWTGKIDASAPAVRYFILKANATPAAN